MSSFIAEKLDIPCPANGQGTIIGQDGRSRGFRAGLGDPLTGVLEIDRVAFDADESLACHDGGNAGRTAAHEGVEDAVGLDGIANVPHLGEWARARDGVAACVAVIRRQVGHVPVAGQFVVDARTSAPENDGVPAEASAPSWAVGIDFTRRDDAEFPREIFVPISGPKRALPDETRPVVGDTN